MKEKLYDVALAVKDAHPKYQKEHIPVVARVHGEFDGAEKNFWFCMGERNYSMYSLPHLKQFGQLVPRNSFIATQILNRKLGEYINYSQKNNIKRIVNHHIVATSKADLSNRVISIFGDKQKYSYIDINSFLTALQNNQTKIEQKEKQIAEQKRQIEELQKQENTAHERSILTKGLNKMEEERRILTLQQEEMSKLTKYIREQGKLRFNPILDPVQNRIKTQNLYNGVTVIIDGGPGTGKTTTMIQRLKYLTDWNAIEEDFMTDLNRYQLTAAQRDHLNAAIKEQRDWVFFSPSGLLKEYLADAMNREGLTNTNAKVWNWHEYRNKVIRENYMLIDPSDDKAPFKASRSKEVLFKDCANVIESFTAYFLDTFKQIKNKFPKIEDSEKNYLWMNIATNIQKRFEECEEFTLLQFVQLFVALEQLYNQDCKELLSENRENVKRLSDEIYLMSKENTDIYNELVAMSDVPVAESNDDTDDDIDISDDLEIIEEEFDSKIIQMIRTWLKRFCYKTKNPDVKLTPKQVRLSNLLSPLLTEEYQNRLNRIGELALFEQYAKYTTGIQSHLFGGFAMKYKRFRRQALANKDEVWNLKELEELLNRRDGKELHPQEQALLIGFINNLVKMVLRVTKDKVNHPFVSAYNDIARPIVGIDEATDFSECDIYAMQSLLYNDYSSLTLCGDLMQRLTPQGIKDWRRIEPYLGESKTLEMTTSYRQSVSLLKVAQSLYEDTIGQSPNYKAYMKSTKVPEPLAYVSDDESAKISWIEKRINEVYVAYGKKLPSIAIFLNNKSDIREFVDRLRDTDFIYDAGIDVVDGSEGNVLASSNQIRVYPIDVVKGMEFDVVFFHNIDNSIADDDLIKRYIYVGVSRAAFFLGITLNANNESITKYFKQSGDWGKVR